LIALVATLACSKNEQQQAPTRLEGPAVTTTGRSVLQALQSFPALRHAVSASTESASAGPLAVALPRRAHEPVRLTDTRRPDFWLSIAAAELSPSIGEHVDDGVLVFDGVAPDTAIAHLVAATHYEEIRLATSPRAPTTSNYRIVAGPGVAELRLREGRIEALDATGVVRIGSAPMFAVDSRGVRRALDVRLTVEGGSAIATATLDTSDLSYPIAIDPLWTAVASMSVDRINQVAVTLPSGKIFVAGGSNNPGSPALSSAEIFDPKTNTWTAAAPMSTTRDSAAGVVVGGKVLVAGGFANAAADTGELAFPALTTAELYDPATNTWKAAAPMPQERAAGGVAAISSTKALVFGGTSTAAYSLSSASIYDYASDAWTTASAMSVARGPYTVTFATLSTGKVLVSGGALVDAGGATSLWSTAELYDPTSASWVPAGTLTQGRSQHAAMTIAGDRVLVVGGNPAIGTYFRGFSTAEIWDPSTNAWLATTPMSTGRMFPPSTTLSTGKVLVAGGGTNPFADLSTAELFDPTTKVWTPVNFLVSPEGQGTLLPLAGGEALLLGSERGGATSAVERYSLQPLGTTCSGGYQCASGFCTNFSCCSVASCSVGLSCGTATKPGSCAKINGQSCAADGDCGSGHCVDGTCCESSCTETCAACDVPGNLGKCWPVAGAPHGARACSGSGAGTTCGPRCDGTTKTACATPAAGTPCGANACSGGTETHTSTCDGAGTCNDTPRSCGAFACGATACATTCATNADCASGYYCKGTCIPREALGSDCSDASTCGAGLFCTEGVCCGSAACPAGSSCAIAPKKGACHKVDGVGCATDDECGSGHCIDGTCCDRSCTNPCEACDVAGKIGTCTAVVGKPHGGRPACAVDPASPCGPSQCDGAETSRCAGFASSDVACRADACKDATLTSRAFCDGKGACPSPVTSSCGGFTCAPSGKACNTTCTVQSDCVDGYACNSAGTCVRVLGTCSSDGLSVVASDGTTTTCAPYLCKGSGCLTRCDSTADCYVGWTCDTSTNLCNPATDSAVDSGGGCVLAQEHAGRAGAPSLLLLALVASAAATRVMSRRR
jgi:N-acetylneuraminic acid mutarotase